MTISPQKLFFSIPLAIILLELLIILRLSLAEALSQESGNRVITPKNKIIPPEINCQKLAGIFIKTVATLRSKVNTTTDTASEAVIMTGFNLLPVSATDPLKITGRSGSTHGASTVKTPAINDMKANVIFIN